jgi:hypothetical protein
VECESFEITIFIQKLLVEIYIEEATQDHGGKVGAKRDYRVEVLNNAKKET